MPRRSFARIAAPLAIAFASPMLIGSLGPTTNFDGRLLAAHNRERDNVGSPALRWDPALEQSARRWAERLAWTGRFEHSPDKPGASPEGENLWAGTKGYYQAESMVGLWIDERADFKPGVFPDNSRSGELANVGHYTQLIWARSTHVGCALARGSHEDFLVCRYSQAGNVLGEAPV